MTAIARWDRLVVRLLVVGGFVWSTQNATAVLDGADAGWRRIVCWLCCVVAGAVTLAGYRFGGSQAHRLSGPLATGLLAVLAAGVCGLLLAAGGSSLSWVVFVPVTIAAGDLDLGPALGISAAPVAAQLFYVWRSDHSQQSLLLNLVAVAAIFAFRHLQRRTREAAEVAEAQQEALLRERELADAARHREDVAAQVHDVLAHTLSGLIVTLQGAGLQARADGVSDALRERLDAATDLAKEGLLQARTVVTALAQPKNSTTSSPAPAEESIADAWPAPMLERLRVGAGLSAEVVGTIDLVPVRCQQVARAVITEAVTNSVRHARGRPVEIRMGADAVQVLSRGDVTAFPPADHVGSGRGLAGLRRRIEEAGGVFTAGPAAAGWLVSCSWPTEVEP